MPNLSSMKACRIIVHGLVQGVFFRQSTQRKAIEIGLSGTVRNRSDGTVEVIAEGEPEKIELLIAWCREGPEKARVDHLDIHDEALKNSKGFIITY